MTDSATEHEKRVPGWCVYESTLEGTPEIEVMCGGLNDKGPNMAGIFRQGNLLHFGFHPDPTNSTELHRGLLLNSIAYIARFTEDRPIGRIPSIWADDVEPASRSYLSQYKHESIPKGKEEREAWMKENRGKLSPNDDNELVPDENLQTLGVDYESDKFFEVAIAALSTDLKAEAVKALARYAPDGPGEKGTVAEWEAYWEENGPYLFFSEKAGYLWLLDPLAKSRQIPTGKLRGSARADK